MTLQGEEFLAGRYLPDLDVLLSAGSEVSAVGAEGRIDPPGVAFQSTKPCAGFGVPDFELVAACRSQVMAVGAVRHADTRLFVCLERRKYDLAGLNVPNF